MNLRESSRTLSAVHRRHRGKSSYSIEYCMRSPATILRHHVYHTCTLRYLVIIIIRDTDWTVFAARSMMRRTTLAQSIVHHIALYDKKMMGNKSLLSSQPAKTLSNQDINHKPHLHQYFHRCPTSLLLPYSQTQMVMKAATTTLNQPMKRNQDHFSTLRSIPEGDHGLQTRELALVLLLDVPKTHSFTALRITISTRL